MLCHTSRRTAVPSASPNSAPQVRWPMDGKDIHYYHQGCLGLCAAAYSPMRPTSNQHQTNSKQDAWKYVHVSKPVNRELCTTCHPSTFAPREKKRNFLKKRKKEKKETQAHEYKRCSPPIMVLLKKKNRKKKKEERRKKRPANAL